jgi:hypothetical protein
MPAYSYLTTTGTIIPDTADLKAEVQAEFRAALGSDLSIEDETPQGVLIVGEVQSRSAAAANNAALANQINPDVSGGVFLDALSALSGLQRAAATVTVVSGVELTGVPGTVIPTGTRARTSAGDVFALVIVKYDVDVDELEALYDKQDVKLFSAIPNFQNPTGISYTEATRERVATALMGRNTLIIEDDPYGDLRFSGVRAKSLRAYFGDQCILFGSFSKNNSVCSIISLYLVSLVSFSSV